MIKADEMDILFLILIFVIFGCIVLVIVVGTKFGWTQKEHIKIKVERLKAKGKPIPEKLQKAYSELFEVDGASKNKETKLNIDNVKSVKILEMTQIYQERERKKETIGSVGLIWQKDCKPIYSTTYTTETVPTGVEYSFSITWRDDTSSVLRFMSGTPECDRLLQFIENNEEEKVKKEEAEKKRRQEIQRVRQNQPNVSKREEADEKPWYSYMQPTHKETNSDDSQHTENDLHADGKERVDDMGDKIVHVPYGQYEIGVEFPPGFYEFWSENTKEHNIDSVWVSTKKDENGKSFEKASLALWDKGPGVMKLEEGDMLTVSGPLTYARKAKPISFD